MALTDFGLDLAGHLERLRSEWTGPDRLSPETLQTAGDILGTLGMIGVVAAYFALEKGYFTRSQLRYYVVNLVGALLLLVSLLINFNLGSFVIELFWVAISLMGIVRCLRERRG
jgi:hypothetical protein